MIEMMVAIVILGMGLLMAATMFPVGWLRARDLAEFTTETSAAESATTTVQLLTRVAGPIANPTGADLQTLTSFLGDWDPLSNPAAGLPLTVDGDVHVLHIENALADVTARQAMGLFIVPELVLHDAIDLTAPTQPETVEIDPGMTNWWTIVGAAGPPPPAPQIAFHERVIPPLTARPDPATQPNELAQWEQRLSERRFAWAVLYKFDKPPPETPTATRHMTFYFVTLRRTRSLQRFARQDAMFPSGEPRALAKEEDVLFPVPWLVNVKLLGAWDAGGIPQSPTGIASLAVANPDAAEESWLIPQMLETGSILIDRLNGAVYTVKDRRFTGDGDTFDYKAELTLDREVSVSDVDTDPDGPGLSEPDGIANLETEDLRDFWVFPPSVLAEENTRTDGYVTFDGKQPVVGVEVRQMFLTP